MDPLKGTLRVWVYFFFKHFLGPDNFFVIWISMYQHFGKGLNLHSDVFLESQILQFGKYRGFFHKKCTISNYTRFRGQNIIPKFTKIISEVPQLIIYNYIFLLFHNLKIQFRNDNLVQSSSKQNRSIFLHFKVLSPIMSKVWHIFEKQKI